MNDIWNEICFELKTCIQKNVLEKEYENAVCNCMGHLGWKKFRGEIVTQYPVQVGHENKYADVVVLQNHVEQFVIEIKRPNHILHETDEKQLFSYMRLLEHQVVFGLYVGEKICLYYNDVTSMELPEQVFSIEIEENNPDGVKFVELFSKESFNVQTLTDFCKEQKEISQKRKQIQNEVTKILSDTSGQIFKDALKEKYLSDGYSDEWIDTVLNQICLNISPKIKRQVEKYVISFRQNQEQSEKDKTKYGFLGSNPFPKNRFVLNVVKHFVTENPKSYDEYSEIFNILKPDSQGVIKRCDSLLKNQERNYFTKENDCLISGDGIRFVVCSQWTISNIQPVIRFAESRGYNVIEYKQ
ncbi:MAG: type I restriction enzyme HsdR N-terminal domain-containing protein [Prevotella sp.]|nr:type I restriction enzyme HsdR N-terminal domain-containing protein [Prevotella sp.]